MEQKEEQYVLGTGADELERLGIQHRVWADAAVQAWKRAGIGPGSHVLDVGCGPGHAALDLAQLITASGKLIAIDESRGFIEYLSRQAENRALTQLTARKGDAQNLPAAFSNNEKFDAIYCRWVLCWLPKPALAIKGMLQLLKPGGRLVIHDYFNWRAMGAAPRSPAIEKMVQAAVKSFEQHSGNVDIAADLPKMLRETGFELKHFEVYQRAARGGGFDSTLAWPLTWWRTYGPKLVSTQLLTIQENEDAQRDLTQIEKDPDRFFFCPPLFEFIANKPK